MPARPPISMGMYDPENHRDASKLAIVKKESKAEEEMSKTMREIELRIHGTGEIYRMPAMVCTTVWDIKLMLSERLGMDPGQITFVTKQGPFWRENKDPEEIARKVLVKGIQSFERQRPKHEHPFVVIGAGHIGLRQAMVFLKYGESNFVIFDRKPKVGGMAWWDQANVTSKLQTELGVYHLGFDETLPCPKNDYPWPSRDELLAMFQKGAEEYGILPYCRLGTEVQDVKAEGQKLDTKYEVTIQKLDDESKVEKLAAEGVLMYPGNLSLPRREEYRGEDEFGGTIAYGMFDEFGYKEATGRDIAIVGHGAFAVENVRSCCEYSCKKIYLAGPLGHSHLQQAMAFSGVLSCACDLTPQGGLKLPRAKRRKENILQGLGARVCFLALRAEGKMMNQYADAVRTFQTFELACQWYEKTLKDTGIPKDGELRPSVVSAYWAGEVSGQAPGP
eukprot:s7744_g2.t1